MWQLYKLTATVFTQPYLPSHFERKHLIGLWRAFGYFFTVNEIRILGSI